MTCLIVSIVNRNCLAGKNVLIYTRNGQGYVHDNIPASVECLEEICRNNNWTCEVSDNASVFTPEKISTFDVLVFSNTNNKIFDSDAQKQVFKDFIQNGGGFAGIHSACGCERDWPWFWSNLGGKFVRHPKLQPFDIKVIDPDHPSTSFLPDVWKWQDECYFMDHLNPDIHVLLAADLSTIDDNEKVLYPGTVFGQLFPLCWYHEFEGGRQWFTALGHQPEHYSDESFIKHLTGGIRWAMDNRQSAPCAPLYTELSEQRLTVRQDQAELLSYQAQPMSDPIGGEKFKGSNFIHPLKTPSGFCVTDLQPPDHLHHFGLWWPWKYIIAEGRKIVCWELQQGEGFVRAKGIVKHNTDQAGVVFVAESEYIDRTAPAGPKVVLHETLEAQVTRPVDFPAQGYFLNLLITNRCAIDSPVEIVKYRYSGFGYRGAESWNKNTSTLLTSEGKDRDTSNFTRAKWVRVQGDVPGGGKAGVVLMSHPDNHDHPQWLRTWDSTQFDGAVFVNFNPVQENSRTFEPGRDYIQQYQLFIYDGSVTAGQAEQLWQDYAGTAKTDKQDNGDIK
ncbi:MAG: ThuA domain-containing protein [Sedimentisphaerales bacterium]|nr:ThuA domain-containing protein [Sedimentisphaerales bacterium]